MNPTRLAIGWTAVVLAAAALSAQKVPPPDQAPAVTDTFLDKAVEWNSAQEQLARLGTAKAKSVRVREFSEMLTKDHAEWLQKSLQLRAEQRRGLPDTPVPTGEYPPITADHRGLLSRLNQLAEEFDKTYLDAVVAEHRVALELFESQAASVPLTPLDTQIIATVAEALPRLKTHLQQAQIILRTLK